VQIASAGFVVCQILNITRPPASQWQ